jgi:hypothetical protein
MSAMCCSAVAASTALSARLAMLKEFCRHRGDPLYLDQLVEADRAQAQVPDQALLLQFGQHLELGVAYPEPPSGRRSRRQSGG